jgi:hypothetical protein
LGQALRSVDARTCQQTPFQIDSTRSVLGNVIPFVDIGDAPHNSPTPPLRVLVIGGIHGDEWTAISLVFNWLNWVDDKDASTFHWRMIPLANPDGFFKSPSTRVNARRVDLNRNFPSPDWDEQAHDCWVRCTRKNPRRYPGPQAASEPETQLIARHIGDYKPNVILSLHAPYNLLDYDGPNTAPLRFGQLSLRRLGYYPGSLGNYAGVHLGIPVVTVELARARQMPSVPSQRLMWADLLAWLGKLHVPPQ